MTIVTRLPLTAGETVEGGRCFCVVGQSGNESCAGRLIVIDLLSMRMEKKEKETSAEMRGPTRKAKGGRNSCS